MEHIERYQPEFLLHYRQYEEPCQCPACQKLGENWAEQRINFSNQQRETLNMGCERAAAEIVFNNNAFVLQSVQVDSDADITLSLWDETLNQQCINLAIHPALSFSERLYAIGVLLSKAEKHLANQQTDPTLIDCMGQQLGILAENGVLKEQFRQLPDIDNFRLAVLKEMGNMKLELNLSMADKMGMILKLSELTIMQPERLTERLHELLKIQQQDIFFSENPEVLKNILLHILYSQVYPQEENGCYADAFYQLVKDFFQIKMLVALWLTGHLTISHDNFSVLLSAWANWRQTNKNTDNSNCTDDGRLLQGLSLIFC